MDLVSPKVKGSVINHEISKPYFLANFSLSNVVEISSILK